MKVNENYYSGKDVQEILGITEPALRNLVNQKKIRKVIPPGRKNGVYLRHEINRFAEQWNAFLLAKDPPKTTFGISTPEDMEGENDLAKRTDIAGSGMTAEVRKAWLEIAPIGDYHVKHNNQIVAFARMLPLKHEYIDAFMDREILERELSAEHINSIVPEKPIEMFVIGITSDPSVDETTRMHYVQMLLRGMGNEVENLGRQGIVISKVYAKSSTPTGIAMATHFGMEEYKPRSGKVLKFVLDFKKSDSYLAVRYKKGFKAWQEEHQKHITKGKRNELNREQQEDQ